MSILLWEACLPLIDAYCSPKYSMRALRITCAPPTNNWAAIRLPHSCSSRLVFTAQESSRHLTKDLTSVFLPLDWCTAVLTPPWRKHLSIDALAHLTRAVSTGVTNGD